MNRILSFGIMCLGALFSISATAQSVSTYSFSATSGTFTAINGSDTASEIHADSKLSNVIPIGFTFSYEGVNYTKLKASSNSFINFDTTSTNNRTGNYLDNVNEPIIAPVWDDNDGRATGGSYASYVTTGTSPNRVFIMEWLNWEWRYNSGTASISYQVKLYETSNKIEFVYKPESGTVSSGTASVGLCGAGTGSGTFISLSSLGTAPTTSTTSETTNINSKPASGQTYTFTPPTCLSQPTSMRDTLITATSASILFNSTATSGSTYLGYYEVTGSGSKTTISGTTTANPTKVNLSGLAGATGYTVSVRVVCSAGDTSALSNYSFSTLYLTPLTVDFVGFTGSNLSTAFKGWSEANSWPNPTGTSSLWNIGNSTQITALGMRTAKVNLYTTTRDEWIISPRFLVASTDSVKFKAAVTNYNSAAVDVMGSDDSMKVLISTNGGMTWTTIMTIDSASAPSNTLKQYSLSIGSYVGQAVQIAFYVQDGPVDDSEDYDFHIADLFLGTPPNIDMKANSAFTANSCLSSSEKVYAIIENNTNTTINFANDSMVVGARIYGQITASLSTTLKTDTLAGGDTLHVMVGTANMSATGTYNVKSFAIVIGDGNSSNDSSAAVVFTQDSTYATPQKVNFAGFTGSNLSTVFSGWSEATGKGSPSGSSSSWTISNATQQTAFGTTSARLNIFGTSRKEWIVSPKISAVSTDSLFFDASVTNWNSAATDAMGNDDSLNIYISSDCGLSWTRVFTIDTANEPSNSLTKFKMSLASYAGNDIIIGFYGTGGSSSGQDYDLHLTNIFIGTPPTKDFGVTALYTPTGGCGDDSTEVKVIVENFGINSQSSVGIKVDITGSATMTLSGTIGSLAPKAVDTILVGKFNTLAGGTFNFKSYTTLTGDQDNTNDTNMTSGIKIGAVPNAPTAASFTVCEGTDTTIIASGSTASYRWYNSTKPDSVIHVGDTLSLMNMTATSNYLVEGFNFSSQTFGPTTAPAGSYIGSNNGRGTGFNVNINEVIIDSVTVYPTGSGWIILKVMDYAGTTIFQTSDTVFITGTNNLTKTRIPVKLTVPFGVAKYKMGMIYSSGITNMGRNTQTYPFNSSGNEMSIIGGATGSGNPTSGNNYWFYDWKITIPGCPSSKTQAKVTVNPLPVFSLGKDTAFCGGSGFSYVLDATTTGASYKWNDNSTNPTLTATVAGTYSCAVTVNGCSSNDTAKVGANPLPTVNFPNPSSICANDTAVNLSGATPMGGVYSGTNVTSGQFDPVAAGAGQDTLYYTFTDTIGCSAMDTAYITVDTVPTVTFSKLSDVCNSSVSVTLSGGAPMGGSYSGSGVVSGVFLSDSAGAGSHNLVYSFRATNGCKDTAQQVQVVNPLPSVSVTLPKNWCLNSAAIKLNTGTPTGGNYFINGTQDTLYSATKAGNDTVMYVYTDSKLCVGKDTAFITADTVPVVAFATLSDACVGSSSITLSQGTPMGGTYSGNSVTGILYNPSMVGMDTLMYSFTDSNNCMDSASQTITVNALPTVTMAAQSNVCDNTPSFTLTGGAPIGGTYSGNGISGGKYDASISGFGTHTIKYVFSDGNSCKDSSSTSVLVNAKPVVSLKPLGFSCNNADPMSLLASGSPIGGTFTGTGVSGTNFDPTAAGTGKHNVSYTFTDANNCTDSMKKDIEVEAAPVFSIIGDTVGCGTTHAPVLKTTLPGMVYHWSNGSKVDSSIITENGQVWAKVTDPNTQKRCFSYDTVNVKYDEVCVGLDERLNGTSVSYYPNPSNGTFNYNIKGFDGLDIEVTIITAGGQEVYRNVWNNVSDKSGEIQLNVMESGLYFINLSTKNGSVMHRLTIMR